MTHTCSYTNCHSQPKYYVIHGCLNQHICEFTVCETHFIYWLELFSQDNLECVYISCNEDITEYRTTTMDKVKT